MDLVRVAAMGALSGAAYLYGLHALLFSRRAARGPLLVTIGGFLGGSAAALVLVAALADGRGDRLVAALGGFLISRAVLGRPLMGPWDGDGPVLVRHVPEAVRPAGAEPSRAARRPRTAS